MANTQGTSPDDMSTSVLERQRALARVPIPNAQAPSIWTRISNWVYINIQRPWIIFTNPFYTTLYGPRPFSVAFMLLWPFPWKYPLPPPLSVQELLNDPDLILRRRQNELNYVALRQIQRFCLRDTPLRSLYRLYESVVTANEDELMQESQYWFHRQSQWLLVDIPDPQDPDPIRYAILASLVEALVHSFNQKIRIGLRRGITNKKPLLIVEFRNEPDPPFENCPSWCKQVGPLSHQLDLDPRYNTTIPPDIKLLPAEALDDDIRPFAKRNITANFVQLYNI
ncbi:hypothetical protein CVT26_003754 [Gymnopilus dilepis]|uniref:Uncharacterized protein n=1 Tax=Gymnopilus dilepis TaxID=231916 RepID=A0A409VRY6_9AGAR|nr:hypothetical protein CVT26_003754 [Gymnopilus dilepis]